MVRDEYEVITYHGTNYKFTAARMFYCAPHIHREIEIGLLLEGKFRVRSRGEEAVLIPGDFWIINPYQNHETISAVSEASALIIELQIPLSFFEGYFPKIAQIEFSLSPEISDPENRRWLLHTMLETARLYFRRNAGFELKCAGQINLFMDRMLETAPYRLISKQEQAQAASRAAKIRKISAYIEENCGRKLLLSEIADQEGLSMSYLTHFFRDCYGMPFQDYLTRIRCERARQLLLSSEQSLLDISISCGFSDPKYFNKGFSALYGCTPREYRKHFHRREQLNRQGPVLTTQTILGADESLEVLDRAEDIFSCL